MAKSYYNMQMVKMLQLYGRSIRDIAYGQYAIYIFTDFQVYSQTMTLRMWVD